MRPALRSALGGAAAIALVSGGIAGLQVLVPAPDSPHADSPAVVTSPSPTRPSAAATSAPTPSSSPSPASTSVPARPPVTVLNNSRITGLAKKAAADFAAGGWPTAGTGNLSGRLAVTTAYYAEGQRDAAEALRRQYPAIKDIAPRYDGLPGSGLTVVVTRDYPH